MILALGFWVEVWSLISDPAHWVQEFIAEATFFIIEIILIDRVIHAHRRGRTLEHH